MKQKVWTGIPIAVWILQITAELFAVYSILKLNMLPMNWMAAVLFLALFVFAALTAGFPAEAVFPPCHASSDYCNYTGTGDYLWLYGGVLRAFQTIQNSINDYKWGKSGGDARSDTQYHKHTDSDLPERF